MPFTPTPLYREVFLSRIPESFQEAQNLEEYLDVAGHVFDDISEQVKLYDWYKDYRYTPEERLELLLEKHGLNITRRLPESIIRTIVRDITTIYTTNGTERAFHWVFRLLGISYTVEKAWLIDPHLYFPDLEFEKDSPFDRPEEGKVYLQIGSNDNDSYTMGEDVQLWHEDTNFLILGIPKIGLNTIVEQGAEPTGDSYLEAALAQRSFNYTEFDYRNFVYGDAVDQENGVYFYGRTFNTTEENLQELRIVGETYGTDSVRNNKFVMATPYILLTIDSEDYSRFVNSYESDEGNEYSLTNSDRARLLNYLFGYLLLEVVKPSTVVILTISQDLKFDERIYFNETLSFDITQSEEDPREPGPIDLPRCNTHDIAIGDGYLIGVENQESHLDSALTVHGYLKIGQNEFCSGNSFYGDIIRVIDNLEFERTATIPSPTVTVTFECFDHAPICEPYSIAIGDGYLIGVENQEYHLDSTLTASGHLKIGTTDFCSNISEAMFGADVTVSWDEQPGVEGYRVYKSTSSFDETTLPNNPVEISGYTTTEYTHFADNGNEFYYAVEPFVAEGGTVSAVQYIQIDGCVPPFAEFTPTADGVCMVPVADFGFTTTEVTCPSLLVPFSVTSGVVDCLSQLVTFSVQSDVVDCDSSLSPFIIQSDIINCDAECISVNIQIGDGYTIGESNAVYDENPDFISTGSIVIGENVFCR